MLGLGLIGDIAQWVAVIIIAGGMIISWRKSGRNEAQSLGVRTEKIASLEKGLKAITDKQDEILEGVNEMKTYCAKVSTALSVRVNSLEKSKRE